MTTHNIRITTYNICYYAQLQYSLESKKTPKYVIRAEAGNYPPMEHLKGRDRRISFYLMDKSKKGTNVPAVRLQGKNSLNFTGLIGCCIDDRLSCYAYGYPDGKKEYGKDKKTNPFFEYRDDGYLFIIHNNATEEAENIYPSCIELIVLEGARKVIKSFYNVLKKGYMDEDIKVLRKRAKIVHPIPVLGLMNLNRARGSE